MYPLQIFTYNNRSAVTGPQLSIWKLVGIPEIPVAHLHKHIIDQGEATLPFEINRDREEESSLTGKLLAHPGTYKGIIGMVSMHCIGVCCLKRFMCSPATQRC